ncbi:MAG: hypothetical protein KIT84_27820 [Labilithrix sp.]|nr:hypothetical protein [Labilithrix sp.]MCW5814868.1 hypothetical protein [Labilithrix sp.]
MTRKLFALASITALTGAVATAGAAGCSSTEVVTIAAEGGAGPTGDGGKKNPGSVTPIGDDDDDEQTKTCLNEEPIDQTGFPYVKSKQAAAKGTCTAKELTDLGAYYKAHVQDDDFTATTWASSVSESCAECIFTTTSEEQPAEEWGPILITDDAVSDINRGGCIEVVSGKEECGRSYQQYQTCLLQACLKDCKTQADFTACRGDQKVLTTACADAAEAVKTACGASITSYESSCKGTTYTFEGPIKVLCINGPKNPPDAGAPKDAGEDAGEDAGREP